jgi:membrane protein DedA with SNARE-associated domain
MAEWFADLAPELRNPWLQGLLAALGTFVLEDPTSVACGFLVADGSMNLTAAFFGLTGGIASGDIGLYFLGRFAHGFMTRFKLCSRERLLRSGAWLNAHLLRTMFTTRFIPGLRLPTFVGAGLVHAPVHRFVGAAVAAAALQTVLLLAVSVFAGELIISHFGALKWSLALAVVVLVVGIHLALAIRGRKRAAQVGEQPQPPNSSFEFWPAWLFYTPVALYWGWLSLRYRGISLPLNANPSVYSSGMVGESKAQILGLVAGRGRNWLARYTTVAKPAGGSSADELAEHALEQASRAGFGLPAVAKPDIGHRGDGVRPIYGRNELAN